jgi:ribosome maturation factor RimP
MADQHLIEHHLEGILSGSDIFLVGVKVDNNNKILVHIDMPAGISIDDCARVSRELEGKLDKDREDFSLEVSSPGLDAPFRVIEQYEKNVGRNIILVKKDGGKLEGILKEMGADGIVLENKAGKKGQSKATEVIEIPFAEIKSARASIRF